MIVTRPMTQAELQKVAAKTLPKQSDINAASSDLHEYELLALNDQSDLNVAFDYLLTDLMARVSALENKS